MKTPNQTIAQRNLETPLEVPYPSEPRHAGQKWLPHHSDRHAVKDWGPSLTKQSEAESCDINVIIARGGLMPPEGQGNFGDFSQQSDFLEAQNIIAYANQQFKALPAKVRARFHNNPAEMLAFVDDPENFDEMVKLGLAAPKSEPPPGGQPAPNVPDQGEKRSPEAKAPNGGSKTKPPEDA